ncbi:MAG: hypothetical protein ABL949_01000 [Fimbriimonadaceae bacterium]
MKPSHNLISDRLKKAATLALGGLILLGALHSGYKSVYGEQVSDMVVLPHQPDARPKTAPPQRVQVASLAAGPPLFSGSKQAIRSKRTMWSRYRVALYDEQGNPMGFLPEGDKVETLDEEDGWTEVQLPDGRVGKVKTGGLAKARPETDPIATSSSETVIRDGGVANAATLTISDISDDAALFTLSNGFVYRIESSDLDTASDWQIGNQVIVRETDAGVVLHNQDQDEEARARHSERGSFRVSRNDM